MDQQQQENTQKICNQCEKEFEKLRVCSACNKAFYCSQQCQKLHWKKHKQDCTFKPKPKPQQEQKPQQSEEIFKPSKELEDSGLSFHQFQKKYKDEQNKKMKEMYQNQEKVIKERKEKERKKVADKHSQTFKERLEKRQEENPLVLQYQEEEDKKEFLTLRSLYSIQQSYAEICLQELAQYEISNRQERRSILKKKENCQKDYVGCILQLFKSKDTILKVAQEEVLNLLGIQLEVVENTIRQYMKDGKQMEIQKMMGEMQQKQKQTIKSDNQISDVEKIIEVFKFQSEYVKSESKYFLTFITELNLPMNLMQDVVPILITQILLDKTKEKFNIEEEDFFDYLKENSNWTEELEKYEKEINEGTYKIIQEFIQSQFSKMRK